MSIFAKTWIWSDFWWLDDDDDDDDEEDVVDKDDDCITSWLSKKNTCLMTGFNSNFKINCFGDDLMIDGILRWNV